MRPLPFDMEPIALDIYRRKTTQHAGALDWFYEIVSRTVATTTGEFEMISGDARRASAE